MADELTRIETKVDKIEEHLQSQVVTLARLTVSVEEHVRRTNLLEQTIKPIEKHVATVQGALKLIALLAAVLAIASGVRTLLR